MLRYTYRVDCETKKGKKTYYRCLCDKCERVKMIEKQMFLNKTYRSCICIDYDKYINRAKNTHNNKYDYSLVNFNKLNDKVIIICPIHDKFTQSFHKHINCNRGCPKCGRDITGVKKRSTIEKFIQKADSLHLNKYDYSDVEYVNAKTKIFIKCKIHNIVFKQTPNDHLCGKGCPTCSSSYGERKIESFLLDNSIKYIKEFRMGKTKCRFDFCLPEYNYLIEFDGIQHFKAIDVFGGEKQLKETQKRDFAKTRWADVNNYNLLRIHYSDIKDIDSILFSHIIGTITNE